MRYFLAIAAILAAGPALAQEIPEGQSCGGLFCDLGIFGHKTAPAAAAPAPPARAASKVAPVPPVPTIVAEPKKRIVRRKHIAPVAVAVRPESAGVPPDASPEPTPVAAVPVTRTVAAPPLKRQPPVPPVAAPPSDEPVIFMSPASQVPVAKDMFQPIYR